MKELLERLERVEKRNRRVENEKAWEVSIFRRLAIVAITYVTTLVLLYSIGSARPFLEALVPSTGYLLSMLSLPILKRWWISQSN